MSILLKLGDVVIPKRESLALAKISFNGVGSPDFGKFSIVTGSNKFLLWAVLIQTTWDKGISPVT